MYEKRNPKKYSSKIFGTIFVGAGLVHKKKPIIPKFLELYFLRSDLRKKRDQKI